MLTERSYALQRAMSALNQVNPLEATRAKGYAAISPEVALTFLSGVAGGAIDTVHFQGSWDSMAPDRFMPDLGDYRERTFATFDAKTREMLQRTPPRPHFQEKIHNGFVGGVERWFQPTPEEITKSLLFQAILATGQAACEALSDARSWWAELHQFRILANTGVPGLPTPEGMHRDGVSYVLVMLIKRQNVHGGETTIADQNGNVLEKITMREPFECLWLDDERIRHGVSPILPIDPNLPAFRDTLVLTFKAR